MKSSHSRCKKVQKVLLHSRRCYFTAKSFNAQLKVLLHSKKFCCTTQEKVLLHIRRFHCTAKSFTAQQKSQICGRNWRKVDFAPETKDKPTLQCLPLDFEFNACAQIGSGRMVLQSPFCGAPDPTSFLEKAQTKRCQIISRRMSKV